MLQLRMQQLFRERAAYGVSNPLVSREQTWPRAASFECAASLEAWVCIGRGSGIRPAALEVMS